MHFAMKIVLFFCATLFLGLTAIAQTENPPQVMEYSEPRDYEIGGIKVTGAQYSDGAA